MTTAKGLIKRLDEFGIANLRTIGVRYDLNLGSEAILPFLLQAIGVQGGANVLVVVFGDSPASLVYSAKRVGLNFSKLPNVELVDGLSLLAQGIEEHYPLTQQPPFTHISDGWSTFNTKDAQSNGVFETICHKVEEFSKRHPNGSVVLSGLEVLSDKLTAQAKDASDRHQLVKFVSKILQLKLYKYIFSFDRSLKQTEPIFNNFMRSIAQLDIKLQDLKSGYSADMAGTITIKNPAWNPENQKPKGLKVVYTNGIIDYVEQIKIS